MIYEGSLVLCKIIKKASINPSEFSRILYFK